MMGDPKGQRGLNELFFFAKEICGFKDLSEDTHGPICRTISSALVHDSKRAGIVIPRDCFKSSIGLSATLWMFTREAILRQNRDWRTLIDTATLSLSSKHLRWIASQLRGNSEYRRLYGDFTDADHGAIMNQREIYVSHRGSTFKREPNFIASAIKAEVTGMHFDLHWYDDLIGERNFHTPTLRQNAWEHYEASLSLKEPDGKELYTATRWHDADVTGRLLKREAEAEIKEWVWIVKSILNEDGTAFFQERYPLEKIAQLRANRSVFLFASQYLNDPVQKEFAITFEADKMYVPRSTFPRLRLTTVTVDPNFRDESASAGDSACIIVGGFCQWMKWWGKSVEIGTWRASEFIDRLFAAYFEWSPQIMKIERKFTSFLEYSIKLKQKELGVVLPLVWIERDNRSKDVRYANLEPLFRGGRVHFANEIEEKVKKEMEDELARCGFSAHDDFLDALSDQFAQVNPVFGDSNQEPDAVIPRARPSDLQRYGRMYGDPNEGLEN